MHEVDMTKALIQTIDDWCASQPEPLDIVRIHLVVGQFTCVEPASLRFAFKAQTQGTYLGSAELEIRETPLIAFCHACNSSYKPVIGLQYACPDCRRPMEDIRSGRELKIDHIEYSSLTHAPNPQPVA